MMTPHSVLTDADLDAADANLAEVDRRLVATCPGHASTRQPVHTVYLAADTFQVSTVSDWGEAALEPTLHAVAARGLLADVETLHLDRGYEQPDHRTLPPPRAHRHRLRQEEAQGRNQGQETAYPRSALAR